MASCIRLPSTGASNRLTAMLSGMGAGFGRGLIFSMGLILCLCAGLIACFAVLSEQMRQPAQVVVIPPAMTADEIFNTRYYPLVDCLRFGKPRRLQVNPTSHAYLPGPNPEDLPTGDPSPKTPLYPRTPAVTPADDAQGAVEVR